MRKVKKKAAGRIFHAWQLGAGSKEEKKMRKLGRIAVLENGRYEVFSQECRNGKGEEAERYDYFKVDSSGYPYPTSRAVFRERNITVSRRKNKYRPKPLVYEAWGPEDGPCDVIDYMVKSGRLKIDETSEDQYFGAELWGTYETSPKTSHILFYSIRRDAAGAVTDVDFNFVAEKQFKETYEYC